MQVTGGKLGINTFNNDHSLGTWTIKKAYWQPRGMPLFSHTDGEHVMSSVKESWENFDINNFNETVCAGGSCNCGNFKPENVITTVTPTSNDDDKEDQLKEDQTNFYGAKHIGEYNDYHIDARGVNVGKVDTLVDIISGRGNTCVLTVNTSDELGHTYQCHTYFNPELWEKFKKGKYAVHQSIDDVWVTELLDKKFIYNESRADYGKNPDDTILANFISNLDLDSICDDNCGPDVYQESTSWANYKSFKENSQQVIQQPQQNVQQNQQAVQQSQQQPQAPVQPQTQQQVQQPVNTTPAQVQPQSQIANPNAQQTQQNIQQQVQQPIQNQQQVNNNLPESTSWANFNSIKESLALPGGQLYYDDPTDYEKELDKHNKARNNKKVIEPENVGDKDAGEYGKHDFNDHGVPTAVIDKKRTTVEKLNDLLKPTIFSADEKAKSNDENAFKKNISDAEEYNKKIDSLINGKNFARHWYN